MFQSAMSSCRKGDQIGINFARQTDNLLDPLVRRERGNSLDKMSVHVSDESRSIPHSGVQLPRLIATGDVLRPALMTPRQADRRAQDELAARNCFASQTA